MWACEERPGIPEEEPEPPSLDVAGVYVEEASVLCEEYHYVWTPDKTDTIVYLSGTLQDTFIVEDSNPEDSLVKIQRLSYVKMVDCSSHYDIGTPGDEYFLKNGNTWIYIYTYDREWNSSIIFNPDKTLNGYMLHRDIFEFPTYDSTGEQYYYQRRFEYEISARRL